MTMHRYEFSLFIDGTEYPIDSDTAPDPAAGSWLLAGLKLSWQAADPTSVKLRPSPAVLSFRLLTTHATNVPNFAIGQDVLIPDMTFRGTYMLGESEIEADIAPAGFGGRITDVEAEPVERYNAATGALEPWLEFSFTAVDYTVDLAEVFIGGEPWPGEFYSLRLDRIEAATIAAKPDVVFYNTPWPGYVAPVFAAKDIDRRPALEVLTDHLDQMQSNQYVAYRVVPAEDNAVEFVYTYPAPSFNSTPFQLTETAPDYFTAAIDPDTFSQAAVLVDADAVDLDATWRKDKSSAVNRILVTGTFSDGTTTREAEHPASSYVTERRDTEIVNAEAAQALADSLLPELTTVGAQRWELESFTIRVNDLSDIRQAAGYFYRPTEAGAPWSPVGSLKVLHSISDRVNLAPRDWYAGQLVGAELEIRPGGQVRITPTLRATLPEPAALYDIVEALAPDNMAADPTLATARYQDLDPTLTYYDFRIIGSPANT